MSAKNQRSVNNLPAMLPVPLMLNTSWTTAAPTYSPSGVGERISCMRYSTDSMASYLRRRERGTEKGDHH